jgi:peptidoglycan hydrolase CwlO-like protein
VGTTKAGTKPKDTLKETEAKLDAANQRIIDLENELKKVKEHASRDAQRVEHERTDLQERLEQSKQAEHGLRAQIIILKEMMRDLFDLGLTNRKMAR